MLSPVFWVGSFGIAGYVTGRIAGSSEIVYGVITGIAVLLAFIPDRGFDTFYDTGG
jgi:hypothetical protein